MREPLKRNELLQFCECEEIHEYAERMILDYLSKFDKVNADDLYLILVKKAGYLCTVANLRDNSR